MPNMNETTISPSTVLDAATYLFSYIEDEDMRRAVATFARCLLLPDIDWDGDFDTVADRIVRIAINTAAENNEILDQIIQ